MKKFTCALIAGIMVTGTAAPVSAQTSEAARFMTALDATFSQLERELEVVNRYSEELLNLMFVTLPQSAYEMSVEMSVNILGEAVGITQMTRIDERDNRFSTSMELFGLQSLLFTPDIALDIYLSDDIIAIGSPLDSDNYFYIRRDITPGQWAETELAQADLMDYEEVMAVLEAIKMMAGTQAFGGMTFELPEGLLDPYAALIRNQLANVRVTSQGEHLVQAQRGGLRTERLTASLGPVPFARLLNDIADTLEGDQDLRDFLVEYISQFGISEAETAIAVGMGIRAVADAFREMTGLGITASYSLYVATNGLAVRQAVDLNVPMPFGDPVNLLLNVDLLGSDFLINEMGLSLTLSADGETGTVSYSQIGNSIMRGGVMEYAFVLRGEFGGNFAELSGVYFWDSNITEDNFYMDMLFEFSAPDLLGTPDVVQFTALWEGTYTHDLVANSFILDSVITGSWGVLLGDPDAYATMVVGMRQINPNLIGIRGNGINIADISSDDEDLLWLFMDILD